MSVCSKQRSTLDLSVAFFRIVMGFMVFQTTSIVLNSALRGIGKTNVTLVSNLALGATDIVFNYLLIEGRCGFPALGVVGDAVATVMGTVAACAVSLSVLAFRSDFLSVRGFFCVSFKKSPAALRAIRHKAGNVAAENILMRIGFLLSAMIVSMMDSSETAVYSVGMIVLNYSFAVGDGLQSGVLALTGRSMGEGNYAKLRGYVRVALRIGAICSVALAAAYVAGARRFFALFFADESSVDAGFRTACFAAAITLFQIFRIICIASLRGMGEVRIPKMIAFATTLVLNPILSYLFAISLHHGIWGIWAAILATQIIWTILAGACCLKHANSLVKLEERRKINETGVA